MVHEATDETQNSGVHQPTIDGYEPADPTWLPRWEIYALAAGDIIALLLFAAVGRANHELLDVQGPIRATINTAGPFIMAWIVVGIVLGAYRGTALFPLPRVLWRTALPGVIAAPIGVVLRAALLQEPIIWEVDRIFFLMATVFSTLFLLVWRVAWSRIRRLWWTHLPF